MIVTGLDGYVCANAAEENTQSAKIMRQTFRFTLISWPKGADYPITTSSLTTNVFCLPIKVAPCASQRLPSGDEKARSVAA